MTPDELRARRGGLGLSQAKLAAALGIAENRYQAWEVGRNAIPPYLHLALDALAARRPRRPRLTRAQAQAILDARAGRTRWSAAELARRHRVSRQTVWDIWHGATWKTLRPTAETEG